MFPNLALVDRPAAGRFPFENELRILFSASGRHCSRPVEAGLRAVVRRLSRLGLEPTAYRRALRAAAPASRIILVLLLIDGAILVAAQLSYGRHYKDSAGSHVEN